MGTNIDKVKQFLKEYANFIESANNPEKTFCSVQQAIIQQIQSTMNMNMDKVEQLLNCGSPQLELGNEILYNIYLLVNETLVNPDQSLSKIVGDLDYNDVMFENANHNSNSNGGYGANNEFEKNNSSVTAITGNNNESVYGWSGNNSVNTKTFTTATNENSSGSFKTAKGGRRFVSHSRRRTLRRSNKGRKSTHRRRA